MATNLEGTAPEELRCERHRERTKLRCADCGKPICPKCMVRTDVGLKCEEHGAESPTQPVPRRDRRFVAIAAAAGGLVLILVALVVATLVGGDDKRRPDAQPAVGEWTEAASLQQIRGSTSAIALSNGTIVVVGGGIGSVPTDATEVFDPSARTWRTAGPLADERRGHQAVLLKDGRVLVSGGIAAGRLLDSSEIYDPATDSWARAGRMKEVRLGHTMTALSDGTVLATGGTGETGAAGEGSQSVRPTDSAEIFNPETQRWTRLGNMSTARFEHTATVLSDGRVLIAGGLATEDGTVAPSATAELYDPASRTFSRTGRLIEARSDHSALALNDGRVLVAGGDGGEKALGSAELYDPARGVWAVVEPLAQPRRGHSASLLKDGSVLVVGGEFFSQGTRTSLTDAELYSPDEDEWLNAGGMRCPRSEHGAALLPDGSVIVAGGDAIFPGTPPIAQSCVDIYAPD